jgi:hypothetical protein
MGVRFECSRFFVDKISARGSRYKKPFDGIVLVAMIVSITSIPYYIAFWSYIETSYMAGIRLMQLAIDLLFVLTVWVDSLNEIELVKELKNKASDDGGVNAFTGVNKAEARLAKVKSTAKIVRTPPQAKRNLLPRVPTYGKGLGKDHTEDEHDSKSMTSTESSISTIRSTAATAQLVEVQQAERSMCDFFWRTVLPYLSCLPYQYLQLLDLPLRTQQWLALISVLKLYRAIICAKRVFHLTHWLKTHTAGVLLDLVYVLAFLIFFGHSIACMFFVVGVLEHSDESWIWQVSKAHTVPMLYALCTTHYTLYTMHSTLCTMY